MGRTFFSRAPPFIVNLGGGDVAVAQELLDLTDIDARIKEQGGRGRAQGKGTSADPEGECDAALEALGPSVEAIAAYRRLRWQTDYKRLENGRLKQIPKGSG